MIVEWLGPEVTPTKSGVYIADITRGGQLYRGRVLWDETWQWCLFGAPLNDVDTLVCWRELTPQDEDARRELR